MTTTQTQNPPVEDIWAYALVASGHRVRGLAYSLAAELKTNFVGHEAEDLARAILDLYMVDAPTDDDVQDLIDCVFDDLDAARHEDETLGVERTPS